METQVVSTARQRKAPGVRDILEEIMREISHETRYKSKVWAEFAVRIADDPDTVRELARYFFDHRWGDIQAVLREELEPADSKLRRAEKKRAAAKKRKATVAEQRKDLVNEHKARVRQTIFEETMIQVLGISLADATFADLETAVARGRFDVSICTALLAEKPAQAAKTELVSKHVTAKAVHAIIKAAKES